MKRDNNMIKQGKTSFNKMMMLSFNGPILLMGMGTRNTIHNPTIFKKFGERAILTTLIRLNNFNFKVKISFNIFLKFNESRENITGSILKRD